jgi:glycyl-tRNA synthetase beta chain
LAEVAGLVEWPVVLMGRHRERFPRPAARGAANLDARASEVLFAAQSRTGRIVRFVTVANMRDRGWRGDDPGRQPEGAAARLSDAKFFWENDLRVVECGMEGMAEGLRASPSTTSSGQPKRIG